MANITTFTPTDTFSKSMFDFDYSGMSNFKVSGQIIVTLSDALDSTEYLLRAYYGMPINNVVWSDTLFVNDFNWTEYQKININQIFTNYSQLVNLNFTQAISLPGSTPIEIGLLSDINISLIYRTDVDFSGLSAGGTDNILGYVGSRLDIIINDARLGGNLLNDITFSPDSYGWHTLMHEIGHSLGLSHPFASSGTLKPDFLALPFAEFNKLGFNLTSSEDLNKEYFTIMSYDDQIPHSGTDTYAQTPMILDVIALQKIYGSGYGTTDASNSTITPGTGAYRTYFDAGGLDTINLSNYTNGSYLSMGQNLTGVDQKVGVLASSNDYINISQKKSPEALRWFYGDYENAIGSDSADKIIGNIYSNNIAGGSGNDTITGGGGDDTLNGGDGNDQILGSNGDTGRYFVDAGNGNDYINLWTSTNNTVNGGAGDDTLSGSFYVDTLIGGDGNDSITGYGGADTINVSSGTDTITDLGNGADILIVAAGAVANATIDAAWTAAAVSTNNGVVNISTNAKAVNLAAVTTGTSGYTVTNIGGATTITGSYAADTLVGATGADTLNGGAGNDFLTGGEGNDSISGGEGQDTVVYAMNASNYTVTAMTGGYQVVAKSGVEGTDNLLNV
jgi:Ca2+-binding RTX toxin-like protein